jgi:predicted  nucleic acid-binding Zn-ribbon protein
MSANRTTVDFIAIAQKVHGTLYDYSKVAYVNPTTEVILVCQKHGDFLQTPASHVNDAAGCSTCTSKKNDTSRLKSVNFIKRAKEKHEDAYDYAQVVFVRSKVKVIIKCTSCQLVFPQVPESHLLGRGCPACGKQRRIKKTADKLRKTTDMFVQEARSIHNGRYSYGESAYTGVEDMITITCSVHGAFTQTAKSHLAGAGCALCANDHRRNTLEVFIEKAREVHANMYDYSRTIYTHSQVAVTIICKVHGPFEQLAYNHIQGAGCSRCRLRSCSKTQLDWLAFVQAKTSQPIQTHMSDSGEFKIGSYHVDGYNAATREVYEFEGCFFHGCLACYPDRSKLNSVSGHTYRNLLYRTLQRGQYIREQGYTVVVMWEHTWTTFNRVILHMQRAFRARKAASAGKPLLKRRALKPLGNGAEARPVKRARMEEA